MGFPRPVERSEGSPERPSFSRTHNSQQSCHMHSDEDIVISEADVSKDREQCPMTGLGNQFQKTPMGADADEGVSSEQGDNDG